MCSNRMVSCLLAAFLIMVIGTAGAFAKNDGLARLPPLGWNSWNCYGADSINEARIKAIADAMVSSGMKDAGYTYVVVDDGWMNYTRVNGNLAAHTTKFPGGMKALGDYIHGKGLKFGLYIDAGTGTCQNRGDGNGGPGSLNNFRRDVTTMASWGVDFIKMDWCNTAPNTAPNGEECLPNGAKLITVRAAFDSLSRACDSSGRKILISMCEWGQSQPWTWAQNVAHMWRTNFDLINAYNHSEPTWGCGMNGFDGVADLNTDSTKKMAAGAGAGHWNDPDMLQVGNIDPSLWSFGTPTWTIMNVNHGRSQFSLWCILAAPMMAGNNLIKMVNPPTGFKPALDSIKAILTDIEALAIDQDRAGLQGKRVRDYGDLEVWSRTLYDSTRAVVVFNRGTTNASVNVAMADIGLSSTATYKVRDIWKKTTATHTGTTLSFANVPANGGCGLFRIGATVPVITNRSDFDTAWHATPIAGVRPIADRIQLTIATGGKRINTQIALESGETIRDIKIFDLSGRMIGSLAMNLGRVASGSQQISINDRMIKTAQLCILRCTTNKRTIAVPLLKAE